MLSHILAGGCFYFGFGPWVKKCEIRGLKTYKCVSSKVRVHCDKAHTYQRRASAR
jgi:hypothetical protein